ncbi:MAG: DUF1192 domain-containing protein [Pseudomonadota bacterium]
MFDDDAPRPTKGIITIGEDLYDFSVEELDERVAALKEEIERVEKARTKKSQDLSAAEALFKS